MAIKVAESRSRRQGMFRDMVLGTLLYSVVLGFFNDYTDMLETTSYSCTFLAAFVLQVLTYLTLGLKTRVAGRFKERSGALSKAGMVFSIWLIMFLSKFVFLEVIDIVFGDAVDISGFIALMVMIVVMMISRFGVEFAYQKLADEQASPSLA